MEGAASPLSPLVNKVIVVHANNPIEAPLFKPVDLKGWSHASLNRRHIPTLIVPSLWASACSAATSA
jgi:hypothetical protein